MPHTRTAGPAIYYETSGDPSGEPLVLIAGATAQLIWWREEVVERLTDRACFVIRLDNRDVGMSAKIGGPEEVGIAYGVGDMADDVFGVLDDLGLGSAHIVGQSLGGMIAQTMAISRPDRVRSMTLFYTVPAVETQFLGEAILANLANLAAGTPSASAPSTREQMIEETTARERDTRSSAYPFDEVWVRDYAARCWDRGFCPGGLLRQRNAAVGLGDLRPSLRDLAVPTSVIHGRDDLLLRVEAGFEIAQLIPEAELHVYPGMGHELPRPLWDEFANIIERTIARGAAPRAA